MAKDLPYFKFFCSEWNDGDITLEDYEIQGLFINICSYYWSNECEVKMDKLFKKFRHVAVSCIDTLLNSGVMKVNEDGYLCITFLDEQLKERGKLSNQNSINAKKRWEDKRKESESNATASIPQSDNSTENMQYREEKKREEKKRKDKPINTPAKAEAKIDFKQLLSFINKTLNKNFRTINKGLQAKYNARLKDGYTKEDIQKAIVGASKSSYHLETNYKHLRPEFFSRADKIDMYSNTGTIPTKGLSIAEQTKHIKTKVGTI